MQNKSGKVLLLIATILFVVALFPFIAISFYNKPVADDFTFAYKAGNEGFFQSQVSWYFGWTGRYFAGILITINSLYINWPMGNAIMPIAFILLFCLSIFYFIKSFGISNSIYSFILFVLVFILYVANLHSISQAFYWIPSLHTYLTGIVIFLFFIGYVIRVYKNNFRPSVSTYLISTLLIAMMTGTSELLIFYQNYILFGCLVYAYLKRKEKFRFTVFLFFVSLAFSFLSLLAPGNFARRSLTLEGKVDYVRQFKVILDILVNQLLPHYVFNIPFILILLLIGAFISKISIKETMLQRAGIKPITLFIFLFLGFLVTLLPQAIANTSEERAFNFSYFTFLASVIISVIYASIYYNIGQSSFLSRLSSVKVGLLLILISSVMIFYPSDNISQAYKDLASGKAECYAKELTNRKDYLNGQKGKKIAYVDTLSCKPRTLFFVDVSNEAKSWKNDAYEIYFQIDTLLARY